MARNDISMLRQYNTLGGGDYGMGGMGAFPIGGGGNSRMTTFPAPDLSVETQDPYIPSGISEIQAQSSPTIQAPQVDPNSMMSLWEQINKIYTPETAARDRFNSFLGEFPQYQGPGKVRGLAGTLMGFGAKDPETALKVMEGAFQAPYRRELDAWKERAQPTYQSAQLENQANINERTLAGNLLTADTAYKRQLEQSRIADEKNRITEEKNRTTAEASLIRARAYDYSQRLGRGWDWDLSGPTAKKINKTTGEIIDTGLQTGKMDEETKILLQNEGRIEAARVTGENAANRVNMGGGNIFQDTTTGKRYRPDASGNLIEVEGGPPASIFKPGTGPRTPTGPTGAMEENRVTQQKMADLYSLYPEARNHIKRTSDGFIWGPRPVITPPNFLGYGEVTEAKVQEYDTLRKMADPNYIPPTGFKLPTGQGAAPPTTSTTAPSFTSTIPTTTTVPPTTGPVPGQFYIEKSASNPNEKRRTLDGGKSWQYSHDGGATWGTK